MSEQVPQSFGAITATNALAGNYFYGGNNITYNAGLAPLQNLPPDERRRIEAEKERDDCLFSFSFREMNARRSDIAPAYLGTCDWLFATAEFREWRQPSEFHTHNGVLWIKGKPGVGKSTLMKHILLHCQTDDFFRGYLCVAYFFNAHGTADEKTPLGMLQSIVYQLLKNEADGLLYHKILPLFQEKKNCHRAESWQWSRSELQEFIRLAVQQFRSQPILILTDALDECVEPDVRSVVEFLESLSSAAPRIDQPLKICLSSRHYPSIRMHQFQELTVEQNSDHHGDIAKYLAGQLRIRDAQIEKEMLERARGVFFWVVITVSLINQAFDEGRVDSIQHELQKTPSNLEHLFLSILCGECSGSNTSISPDTVLTLLWVLLSERQLLPGELCAAVLGPIQLAVSLARRRIVTLSKGLVEFRGSKGAQFIHLSVRDFLVRHGRLQTLDPSLGLDPLRASHGRLWARCWASVKEEEVNDPLFDYATTYILEHAEKSLDHRTEARNPCIDPRRKQDPIPVPEVPEEARIRRWLRESDRWFPRWLPYGWPGRRETAHAGQPNQPHITLPYVLTCLGLTRLLRAVLDSLDLDAGADPLSTALHVASFQGRQEVVKLLITHGADVHLIGSYHTGVGGTLTRSRDNAIDHGSALGAASKGGHYEIARLLIESGADADARSATGNTPLHAASAAGHYGIAGLLIHHGADANARSTRGNTPLHAASAAGHREIANLLIHHGADANAEDGWGNGPLHAAAFRGHSEVLQLLVGKGAVIDARNKDGNTALHVASMCAGGRDAAVQMLIDHGADIDARGQSGDTALQLALKREHGTIVKLLIENNADLDAPSSDGYTALQQAVEWGREDIVRLLIDKGVDVNARSGDGSTALDVAFEGHPNLIPIAELLVAAARRSNAVRGQEVRAMGSRGTAWSTDLPIPGVGIRPLTLRRRQLFTAREPGQRQQRRGPPIGW